MDFLADRARGARKKFFSPNQWNFGWMLGAYLACKMPWRTVR